jgi:hypothetical protein
MSAARRRRPATAAPPVPCTRCGGTGQEPTAASPPLLELRLGGIKLESEANAHTHWRVRQRRAKAQRAAVDLHLLAAGAAPRRRAVACLRAGGLRVRVTRVAPHALDSDNATGSAKHVRDAVAKWLGVDDGSKAVSWEVEQAHGQPREHAVLIQLWGRA